MNSTGTTGPSATGKPPGEELLEVNQEDLLSPAESSSQEVASLGEEFQIEGSVDPDQISEREAIEAPAPSETIAPPEPSPVTPEVVPAPTPTALRISQDEFLTLRQGPNSLQILDQRLKVLRSPLCIPAEPISDKAFPFDA